MTSLVLPAVAHLAAKRRYKCILHLLDGRAYTFLAVVCCLLFTADFGLASTTTSRTTTSRTSSNPNRNMSHTHAAFANAGTQPGLKIWRIENFEPKPYPEADYGKFYSGDSYIVLFTKVDRSGKFSWDIHFWLGNNTSQDESGAAAILSVDLDDSLGGAPVQHREVQEHESQLFLSHFPSGVRYLPGGVASGFTHVDPDAVEKRLFQVKGRRNVRVRQIPLSVTAMNKGDCFILDVGKEIFVYTGTNSKRTERLKAISAANQIRDQDHAGRSRVHIIDQFSTDSEVQRFFTELGSGSPSQVPDESTGGDDDAFERTEEAVVSLYKVSDESGTMRVDKVGQKPLHHNQLNSAGGTAGAQDCFILDTVSSGLFVWIGRNCNRNEKLTAMNRAQQFLHDNNYPNWTTVQRVVQGAEPAAFKQYFAGWRERRDLIGLGRIYTIEQIAASMPEPDFNPASLHASKIRLLAKSAGRAFGFMPDDGTGQVDVFRVENFELARVGTPGFFFGGDSYVIKYTYQKNGRDHYIIYFWQGSDSTQDERASSALHAVQMDNELNGRAVQVRVTQGNEPRHFLRIFQGRMVVFMGGHASGFKNLRDHDTYDTDGTMLFQVRGSCPEDVRAVQVAEKASSLNSDDAFYLVTPSTDFLWYGKDSSPEEREMAANISKILEPTSVAASIDEGSEPAEFWTSLGGKGPYTSEPSEDCTPLLPPRLFHCHIPSGGGKLKVEEIENFKQEDLDEDDVMVLDSGDEIYVWVGKDSTTEERDMSMKMAEAYLKSDPTERSHDLALIFVIHQGDEDKGFTSLFPDWNDNLWETLSSYNDIKAQVAASNERDIED